MRSVVVVVCVVVVCVCVWGGASGPLPLTRHAHDDRGVDINGVGGVLMWANQEESREPRSL